MAENYRSLLGGYKPTTANPLDTKGDYRGLLEGYKPVAPTQPVISNETMEALPKAMSTHVPPKQVVPPTETGSVVPGLTQAQQTATAGEDALAAQGVELSPYLTGASYGTGVEQIQQEGLEAGQSMSLEGRESYKEWYKEEGLPAAGMVLGTIAAPVTGGSSFWGALAVSAASTGVGAFTGEAAEQVFKKEGVMPTGIGEEAPRNGWDILERSVIKGTEEAALDAVGGLFLRGLTHTIKKGIQATGRLRVDVNGKVLDQGREDLVNTVRKWAEREGKGEEEALLASQVAYVSHYAIMEDVAKASYIGAKPVEKALAQQEQVIIGEAKQLVGDFTTMPKATVAEAEGYLGNYYKANMDNTNDFVVAGLVRKSFTDAQNQQKSIARSIYNTMDSLANKTDVKQVMEEVPTGFFHADGSEIMTRVAVTKEVNKFPVRTQEVREWAADKVDESLLKADPVLGELMDLPQEATMKQVGEALAELKGRSRTLADSIKTGSAAENAPRRKLLLDEAITKMEASFDDAIELATEAGIRAPDGRLLRELKDEADGIWKQQVTDFQNTAITKILENTDLVNGAPDELVTQFLKSPANAEKVLKALKIGKDTLEGEALDHVFRAEQMIKGSLIERVLLPTNPLNKSYGLPDKAAFTKNSETLKQLLGDETYEATRRLVGASEQHSEAMRSSAMAFAQKAREANMTMKGIEGAVKADPSAVGRVTATLLVAVGAGKILTNPRNLKFAEALELPNVSPAYKRRALRFLTEEWTRYVSEQEDALSPSKREQLKAIEDARIEDIELGRQGM